MNLKKLKIYHIYLVLAIITLILGLIIYLSREFYSFTLNIHDTFLIIPLALILKLVFAINFIFGIFYWWTDKNNTFKINPVLPRLHHIVAISSSLFYFFGQMIALINHNNLDPYLNEIESKVNLIFVYLLILSIFLFFTTLILALVKRRNNVR